MKRKLLATLVAAVLVLGIGGMISALASEWNWAGYGFSGTAVAGSDPFEKTSYLIGGYVATVNHLNPTPDSYIFDSNLVLDTEGVAIRFRFSWANTEPGFKAIADLAEGIAVYPMDDSLDVAVATADGVERYSFPVPAAYDYMSANNFTIKDNSSEMLIELCGKTVAILKFGDVESVDGKNTFADITVTDGNGYVYGRLTDARVMADNCYMGYSSQVDKALIQIKWHALESATFEATLPEEKETTEGWTPETESVTETETETESVTETQTETESVTETETETESVTETETETKPVTETETESESVTETQIATETEVASESVTSYESVTETKNADIFDDDDDVNGCFSAIGMSSLLMMLSLAGVAVAVRRKNGD